MQAKTKSLEETLGQVYSSRVFLCGVVVDLSKLEREAREKVKQEYEENISQVIEQANDPSALGAFIRKKLKNTTLSKLAQLVIEYETSFVKLESELEGKLQDKDR